jgi:predicted phosphate transport protein (TIGR00153 family)
MFGRFMPQEGRFFELFNLHAHEIVEAGKELVALMNALGEGATDLRDHANAIDAIEKRGDTYTRECIQLLHKTFITPLDREEIHQLISNMDDVLDLMQDCAESVSLYDIKTITPEAKQLAEICMQCCDRVKSAVALLSNMDNASTILKICEEIDRLESDADRVMRSAISKLFRTERDVLQLIKLKAIYEVLETVTDRCEDVANVMQGIVIENA